MKKKFLIFTLCFTLIFSSLNYKKSYADAGILSAPLLATVVTVAVGSGVIINSYDDIVNIGRIFYDCHKDNMENVNSIFNLCVSIGKNKLVSVGNDFLELCKTAFDMYNNRFYEGNGLYIEGVGYADFVHLADRTTTYKEVSFGNYVIKYKNNAIQVWTNGVLDVSVMLSVADNYGNYHYARLISYGGKPALGIYDKNKSLQSKDYISSLSSVYPSFDSYDYDSVLDKVKDDKVVVGVPGNLSDLVGVGSSDVFNPNYDLPVGGLVTVPGVSSPSVEYDDTGIFNPSVDNSIPGTSSPSVPSDGIWSNIKDFIISLVVPNDSYWTDTWGGLYNNFTNSFPMVDMDGFNDLVTGEKKFPNIDINIMGVTGRVVNGDVVNSIVDWLRPIIAGFMMLCLMLFNYRKIYKMIRNSEPFGGIAPGTSDFSTGISEYSKQDVVKATDMVAEYRAWKERGGK